VSAADERPQQPHFCTLTEIILRQLRKISLDPKLEGVRVGSAVADAGDGIVIAAIGWQKKIRHQNRHGPVRGETALPQRFLVPARIMTPNREACRARCF